MHGQQNACTYASAAGVGRAVQHSTARQSAHEDLGDEQRITNMLERLSSGNVVPGVHAFKSQVWLLGSTGAQEAHVDSRQVLKSSKNVQLQVNLLCASFDSSAMLCVYMPATSYASVCSCLFAVELVCIAPLLSRSCGLTPEP